jgi:hypothetical protein
MAALLIQRGPMRSRRLHLRDLNYVSEVANLQRPPNKRLEKDLRPARYARRSRPRSLGVRPIFRCARNVVVTCWAKVFSVLAVILLALSISPTGELFDANDSWITAR